MRNSATDKSYFQRRFAQHYRPRGAVPVMSKSVMEGHTIFRSRVVDPVDAPRVLVSGANNSKIGRKVTVGRWKGMPIYQLTLEERATCDRGCHHWFTCYGNSMHLARRHRHGAELEMTLDAELAVLQRKHRNGFVIRLHVLGDFYSAEYVERWREWLTKFPALNVFGFTYRQINGDIGRALANVVADFPDRFALRWSIPAERFDGKASRLAITLKPGEAVPSGAFACPAQTNDAKCCATCGACWQSQRTVAFFEHGNSFAGRRKAA